VKRPFNAIFLNWPAKFGLQCSFVSIAVSVIISPNRADYLLMLKLTVCCSDNLHMPHEIWFADATRGTEAQSTEQQVLVGGLRSRGDNGRLVNQRRKRTATSLFPKGFGFLLARPSALFLLPV
jgi:hypothetical protein